ncbi:carcinoembryonic antigen-related cell adhesion molecule 6-like [Acanthopagrus latus]|uniref:carcinoembryonic antigen-related cell adhesion molecule 6-like n=1 Tax=Acanthopagrus latus TaxID=8177 RepID=UPI00187CBF82|nr:carcinoembryonic antigen-related cell adhesion molecule 6-like [Acanthopagrus latus]
MRFERRNLTWTLMPLFLAGVICKTWEVEYQRLQICAVKGSSVVIPCSLYHPDNLTVKRVIWGHVTSHGSKGYFVSGSNFKKATKKFQYIGDKQHNCSLKIHQVESKDAGKYTVRLSVKNMKYIGSGIVRALKVVDLYVELTKKTGGNEATKEGDSVNLTCINGCDGDHLSSAFTWFKNGEPKNEGPVLYLSNMNPTDSGNYSCSLKTHTGTASRVININVEYAPKNTSVSVRPSMEVEGGTNITLICSSHANPPVDYTWFKIDESHVLDVGHQPELFSADGGQYFCSATNKHGSQNSSVVTVKIKASWPTFTRDVLIISVVTVLLIVTGVFVVRRLMRKRRSAPETDCVDDIQNTNFVNWPVCEINQLQEGNQTELVYAAIDFSRGRESNTQQQQMESHDDVGVIYSTVCRLRPLNLSYIEPH